MGKIAFALVAVGFSLFYAWYAVTIFGKDEGKKLITICSERRLSTDSRHHWSWWFHQLWVNLGGVGQFGDSSGRQPIPENNFSLSDN